MGRLFQLFLRFPICFPNFWPMSTTVPLFYLEDNVDSFCTQNDYLVQYGPQGKLPWEWQGQAGLHPSPCHPDCKPEEKGSQQPELEVRNCVLIHNLEDQTFVILKTVGANSSGSIKAQRRQWETSEIDGMGLLI